MKLTPQLVVVVLNALTKFRDNLFKFTLYTQERIIYWYTVIIYKVGDTRCHLRLTNSKDIIQKDREHARRSSWAWSTCGQKNEAWAVYKKNPSRESWGGKFRRVCGVCSSELWLARKNNCLLSSIFPAREGGFGQMMYWSPERSS